MAKTPKKTADHDSPPPAGRAKPNRVGKPINVWVESELRDALESFMTSQRVTPRITDVVSLAIEEFLTREGFWPPPASK